MSSLDELTELLGGPRVLGRTPRSQTDFIAILREGLPYKSLESVAEHLGLKSLEDAAESFGFPRRTLHRRKKEKRLDPSESERVLRVARVVQRAEEVLGTMEKAWRWLGRPNRALGGERPLDLLDTDLGTQAVEAVLGRIEHGVIG